MKNIILMFLTILASSSMVFGQAKYELPKDKQDTFESKMIKAVMHDAYIQYKSKNSIEGFIKDSESDKLPFAKTFSKTKYQGSVELRKFQFYRYIVENGIIYWEKKVRNKNSLASHERYINGTGIHNELKKTGKLDINKFYRDNIKGLANEKCPLCVVGIVGIIVGAANCVTTVQLCNTRCANCIYGASVCESSCFTNSCSVTCNPPPTDGNLIFDPWGSFDDWIINPGPFTIDP